jgi:predicted glycosyltransferase
MSDKFLITMDQLKALLTENVTANRLKIVADVMNTPYKEKTLWDNLDDLLTSLVKWIEDLGEDKKKAKKS